MTDFIKIAVDAMGGDGSPKKIVDGIIFNHKTNKNNFFKIFGDENKILDYIEQYLASSEFSGEIIRNKGGIIAYHPTSSSSTALVGHVDTVPIDNNQVFHEDFSKVYGRGSVDMKSGLAVMLEVLTNNFKDVVAVFYTAEEGPMVNNGLEILMPILNTAAIRQTAITSSQLRT